MVHRMAEYKGRRYRLLWVGDTARAGKRAKLAFLDGSREFWADGRAITPLIGASARYWCEDCGREVLPSSVCIGPAGRHPY